MQRIGAPEQVRVTVADWAFANAFAGPGGEIVLTRGLIEGAAGPDEVAGVLAHEMGHVAHHHPMRALLRHYGISLLLGSVGGRGGELADVGLVLSATRAAEGEADGYALAALTGAGVSADGLAGFFQRQLDTRAVADSKPADDLGLVLAQMDNWARTHPPDAERLAMIRASAPPSGARPALTPADLTALQKACADRPQPKGSAPAAD